MKEKVFQFNPEDYGTTYEVVKGIYIYGAVAKIGNQIAIAYTYEWQLMSLFVQMPTTTYTPPVPVPAKPSTLADKMAAITIAVLCGVFLIWLYFF